VSKILVFFPSKNIYRSVFGILVKTWFVHGTCFLDKKYEHCTAQRIIDLLQLDISRYNIPVQGVKDK
jgi:hypothetical protein